MRYSSRYRGGPNALNGSPMLFAAFWTLRREHCGLGGNMKQTIFPSSTPICLSEPQENVPWNDRVSAKHSETKLRMSSKATAIFLNSAETNLRMLYPPSIIHLASITPYTSSPSSNLHIPTGTMELQMLGQSLNFEDCNPVGMVALYERHAMKRRHFVRASIRISNIPRGATIKLSALHVGWT